MLALAHVTGDAIDVAACHILRDARIALIHADGGRILRTVHRAIGKHAQLVVGDGHGVCEDGDRALEHGAHVRAACREIGEVDEPVRHLPDAVLKKVEHLVCGTRVIDEHDIAPLRQCRSLRQVSQAYDEAVRR